jgi:glycosyltransferase involved in cell wall biosynthesis
VLLRPHALKQAWLLAQYLRRERIDVLQMYFPDSTYLGVVAGRLAGVPRLVRSRHNLGHDLTPALRRLNRLCNLFVHRTVANCHAARRSLLAEEGTPADAVTVLENGVDLSRFRPIPTWAPPPIAARRVGVVANLRPVKGLEVLIDAAALLKTEFPDLEFHVAGEGDQRPALEQRVRERGLEGRFHLPGATRDVPGFLATLDLAVLCSHSEGMSNAILEYMAAGRPVAATRVGAADELIEDGVSGLLVPPAHPGQLADAIGRLLREPETAARLAAAARERAYSHFSREAMVARYEDFYLSLAGVQPAAARNSTEV